MWLRKEVDQKKGRVIAVSFLEPDGRPKLARVTV
jgi:hypothetical protein